MVVDCLQSPRLELGELIILTIVDPLVVETRFSVCRTEVIAVIL